MPFRLLPRSPFRSACLAGIVWGAALSLPARAIEAPDIEAPDIEAPDIEAAEPAPAPADSARVPATPASAAPAAPAPTAGSQTQPAAPQASPAPQGNPAVTPAEAAGASPAPAASTAPSAAPAAAQAPSDGPEIEAPSSAGDITVEVDPRQSRNQDRSLPLAMLYSAVLPGTGELYLREKPDAKAFLLAEAGFWASLYVAFVARESYLSSARNYASEYAGIDASGKSAGFLETMANYRSYLEKQHRQDSYELAQILSGKRDRNYDIKADESNYWDFGSSVNPENTKHWNTFQSTLRYYRASKVAISFAVGALALNRLASLANTLRVYKHTSAKGLGLNVTPELGPESVGSRLTLRF